jgi:hypothetical protein
VTGSFDQPEELLLALSVFEDFFLWWECFLVAGAELLADSAPCAKVGIALRLMPATTVQVTSATMTFFTKKSPVSAGWRRR